MPVRHNTLWIAVLLLSVVALLVAPRSVFAAPQAPPLNPDLCAPDQHTFTSDVDNAFFPLPVDRVWVYTGKEQGQTIGLRITVLGRTESFYSGRNKVETLVVEEREWEDADGDGEVDDDEFVIEVSLNYYAQTQDNTETPQNEGGTVCYFGEDVDIFHDDGTVTHDGEWRADGAENHAPGIFMPADPEVGMTFKQESAPGTAEDEATIIRSGRSVTVPAGTFTDTITVRDFNPLDGSKGTKVYARNVGLIQDGPLGLLGIEMGN
jgi:hypothetical protein